jgi:cytochrome c
MSLEANKIAAAVLTAGVTFGLAGLIADFVVHPNRLSEPAISLGRDAPAPAATAAAAPVPAAIEPITALLASANLDNGRQLAQRSCGACHSFNEGGRNGVGPNLWGIVGKNHAAVAGFNYSAANRALADKPWTFDALNEFIAAPNRAMPGTRMAFAGLANTQARADIIAWMRMQASNPVPLP